MPAIRTRFVVSAALLTLSGMAMAAPPINKSGPCPTFTRSNSYMGVPLTGDYAFTGKNWAATPKPASLQTAGQIQDPLSPDSSINCVQVPPGLKAQIVASERTPGPTPAVAYIMYFSFDEKGRMWVVDNRDYPHVHNLDGTTRTTYSSNRATGGKGRVLIFEDTDRDGSMDNYKVFYEGLMGPTSLEYIPGANAGVITTVPPNVYFIPKSSGNPDTAGAIQTVVSGMGSSGTTYDTHGQPNSLTAGIDNFYYGHTGYNGCGSPVVGTNRAVPCGNGNIWRFKATAIGSDTNTFQLHSTNDPANAHGIGTMEDGQWFKSGATLSPHINHQIRHNTGATSLTGSVTRGNDYWPLTHDRWLWEGSTTTVDSIRVPAPGDTYTGSSAASGSDFYTARLLPKKYWSRFQFVCEGASKLCNQDSLTVNGSTWRMHRLHGKRNSNIFASTDAWTAPLKVRTGPDGGLWVLDFYNYLFLHNPALPATMSAWNSPLRAKSRVRIYRIIPESGVTQPLLDLSNATVPQLIATLGSSNMHWRLMAQKLLLNRNWTVPERNAIVDSLYNILKNNTTLEDTALGTSPKVLHALWTAHGMKSFTFNVDAARWDSVLGNLLLHPAWTVRRNTLLAMPSTVASANAIKSACSINDEHPHVRIQALDVFARTYTSSNDTIRAQSPMPMPASGPAVSVTGLRDSYANTAFTAASNNGKVVDEAGSSRPTSCPSLRAGTIVVGVNKTDARFSPVRKDIRFDVRNGGFSLSNTMQLGSGELVVRDLRGMVAFRSTYNAANGGRWSNPVARNLNLPVYFYTFREIGGATFNGRIVLASGF